ncbi:MAG: replicative DNA helicase [Acidobacteriota bacterium]|nr:replicative DNA helicase [Acidobacteriota bacterium]
MDAIQVELKGMPHHDEAERVCLGSMLLESNNIAQVLDLVKPDDFYRRSHQLIFKSIVVLFEANSEVDPVLLSDELLKQNELQNAGGLEYLDALTEGIPRTTNIEYYAGIVKEKSMLRRLVTLGQELSQKALLPETLANEAINEAEGFLFKLREGDGAAGFQDFPSLLNESYQIIEKRAENKGELVGLTSGFADFDRMTNGMHDGDLMIVAARPAMGKTSFCLNVGLNAALKGAKVVIYSLEMPASQLVMRLLGSEARVGISSLRSGNLSGDEWNRLGTTVAALNDCQIFIEDSGESTVAKMRADLKRLKMEKGVDLVIIDYLQLMSGSAVNAQQSRVQEVSAISRGLKIMAKEVNCPVIALSQLSRAAEQRSDHRPQLSDLRESGSIEQDADIVTFLFREDYYKEKTKEEGAQPQSDEDFGVAELIIAKHRNGPTGVIELAFFKKFTRFENYSDEMEYA